MEENTKLKDTLQEKIDNLGSDTIFGTMQQMVTNEKNAEKLSEAVKEYEAEQDDAITKAAISGDGVQALQRAGWYRKTKPIVRDMKKVGRNEPCPCGSGKKYKNCCLDSGKYETTHYKK